MQMIILRSYVIVDDINGVMTSLEKTSKALFEWFENNLLKSNVDNVILSFSDAVSVRVYEYGIKISEREKFLGVRFDNELTFEKHITGICEKASTKIYALARIAPHMDLPKRRMVMNVFFQFAVQLLSTDLDVSQLHDKFKNKHAS